MKNKRRPFTLLEVLISISLSAIILAALFSSLRTQRLLARKIEKAHKSVMTEWHIQERLSQAFSTKDLVKSSFYTKLDEKKSPILFFTLKKQIDLDLDFAGSVEGYFSLENIDHIPSFCLTQKGKGKEEKKRREILAKNIKSVTYEFLFSDKKDMKVATEWKKGEANLPYFGKLTLITQKGGEIEFAFWISKSSQLITATKGSTNSQITQNGEYTQTSSKVGILPK